MSINHFGVFNIIELLFLRHLQLRNYFVCHLYVKKFIVKNLMNYLIKF